MNLMHLIKSYSYLKFFVDVYEAYRKEFSEPEDSLIHEIEYKYKAAKDFLSYIEMSLAVLPINTRSNYNNQYEFVYRKVYIEKMTVKKVATLLNTSYRNAYSIRARALDMIEERVELLFEPYFQITEMESKTLPVIEPFTRRGKEAVDSYFDTVVKMVYTELGMIEGDIAGAFLLNSKRRQISRAITNNHQSMTRSAFLTKYQRVTDHIGVCLYGFDYFSAPKGYKIIEKSREEGDNEEKGD